MLKDFLIKNKNYERKNKNIKHIQASDQPVALIGLCLSLTSSPPASTAQPVL
jgi:hypothetical protein